ncbi:hypothetical protein BGZ99_008766 [Dissophora globulifera]|uniref:Uncharacterized protein n=1 Tax=Dissophora globulifera TaxID=979702 RepID=A0A9P6RX07_9FUNG|nr:hypothetical protein BGZ99_008766 [Dissophora globulifera]
MPGQVHGQGPSSTMQQHISIDQSHPLDSNYYDNSSRYPPSTQYPANNYTADPNDYSNSSNYVSNSPTNPSAGFHNATPHQLEQLHLQKQHQQRLQEQIQTEDSIRMQQHRVARPNAAAAMQDPRTYENKPANYYAYPPQQNLSSTSLDNIQDGSFKARVTKLVKFPCSNYGKALMIIIAVEALMVIIMQTVIVVKYFRALRGTPMDPEPGDDLLPPYLDPRNQSRSIPAYLIVFVFAQLFQLVLAWDAVRAQNTIEMIAIVSFNLCCFAYSIFEISQTRASLETTPSFLDPNWTAADLMNSLKPFLIVVVVVIGVTQCIVTWLAYQLFQEFGWKIYKKIGADPNMKKMYRSYQIYLVLIKVDLFFFVGFSIQFIYLTLTKRAADPEYWLTIIVLPLTILILYIAVFAVRTESRHWMTTFIVAMLCGVAYFLFKVVRMYMTTGDQVSKYLGVNKFMTLFAALCLVTILVTIANAAVCYRNFGKGLKPQIEKESRETINATDTSRGRVLEID